MAARDDDAVGAVGAPEDDVRRRAELRFRENVDRRGEGRVPVEDARPDKAADGGSRRGVLDAPEDVREGEVLRAPVVAEREAPREHAGGNPGHGARDGGACVERAPVAREGGVDGRVARRGPRVVEVAPVDDLPSGAAGNYGCAPEERVVFIGVFCAICLFGGCVRDFVKVLPRCHFLGCYVVTVFLKNI